MSSADIRELLEPDFVQSKAPYFHRHWKAYSTLVGGFIYMIYLGSVSVTGNISPYIAIYFNILPTRTSKISLDL
jgi:hypothetical protein